MIVQFGQFCFSLTAPQVLLDLLPEYWKSYLAEAKSTPNAEIIARLDSGLPVATSETYWTRLDDGNLSDESTVLFQYQTGRFVLSYRPDSHRCLVTVAQADRNVFITGVLHAVLTVLGRDCIGVHAVTIICENQLILLSARSGTGKTTLADLLLRHCHAATINGDFALLSVDDGGQVMFEPTPFCGSSRVCHNHRFSLDRIVFLEQSPDNRWYSLNPAQGYARLISNTVIPFHDDALIRTTSETALRVIGAIPTAIFAFAPTEDAAQMFFHQVTL